MLLGNASRASLTEAQKRDFGAIVEIVELLTDKLGEDVQSFPANFAKDLEDLFDSFKARNLIVSFKLESSDHHFGVDFVLLGTEKAQSVFGSTVEMTIEEVDEILKVPGKPMEKRKRSIVSVQLEYRTNVRVFRKL